MRHSTVGQDPVIPAPYGIGKVHVTGKRMKAPMNRYSIKDWVLFVGAFIFRISIVNQKEIEG